MLNTTRGKIFVSIAALLLVALLLGIGWTAMNFVFVDWKFYPRKQFVLNLQGQAISEKTYEKLSNKLPNTWIFWDVPFQGVTYSSDIEEITLSSLTDEDVAQLDYFIQLKTVHAEDCRDYPQLLELYQRRRECEVLYNVEIDGRSVSSDTEVLTVSTLTSEEAERLAYLPKLSRLDGTECRNYSLLMELDQTHPEWNVVYSLRAGNKLLTTSAADFTASEAAYDELAGAFSVMPNLKTVHLKEPVATGKELQQLRADYPNVKLTWELTIQEQLLQDDATELDITGMELEQTSDAAALADYFPNLEKLIMTDCGFDNETMAAFREEKRPEYKVVWTVYLTAKCKARTDDTLFMPIKQGEYYFQDHNTPGLEYCEDIEAMDIGHSRVRDISFVANMPHLKYLIVADSDVRNLEPLRNCKELIWLELGWCAIESFEPLTGCTALEDLNIGRTYAFNPDPEPITRMTWLKNLWCIDMPASAQWKFRDALKDTWVCSKGDYELGTNDVVAYGWRRLPNYFKMRDALGMYYMK